MDLTDNPYTAGYFENAEGSNYRNYGDDWGWPITAKTLRGFLPEVSYPKLLELGSAKGYFLQAAFKAGFSVQGIDISKHAVENTPMWLKHLNRHGDVTQPLPFAAESYDVVCSWEFFEHIEVNDLWDVVKNTVALVKPGGLYVHRIALLDGGMEEDHDSTHVSMFNRYAWEDSFDFLGLKCERELEYNLRNAFRGRDWAERFFVWRRP